MVANQPRGHKGHDIHYYHLLSIIYYYSLVLFIIIVIITYIYIRNVYIYINMDL